MSIQHPLAASAMIYQDPYMVVCNKPVGLASQPTANGQPNLLDLLAQDIPEIGLVHRLDTLTGGIMVYATRAGGALGKLCTTVQNHDVFVKEYLAITDHTPVPVEGELCDHLYHDKHQNKAFVVSANKKRGKEAVLRYRVLASKEDGLSLVHIRLYTGRTHQIRVQFGSRGWPLCGDGKYGSKNNRATCALWAYRISFPHPKSGKSMSFACLPSTDTFPWNLFSEEIKLPTFNETIKTEDK